VVFSPVLFEIVESKSIEIDDHRTPINAEKQTAPPLHDQPPND
jgi:hypothetical protein